VKLPFGAVSSRRGGRAYNRARAVAAVVFSSQFGVAIGHKHLRRARRSRAARGTRLAIASAGGQTMRSQLIGAFLVAAVLAQSGCWWCHHHGWAHHACYPQGPEFQGPAGVAVPAPGSAAVERESRQ
jgi:hypothetical protein